MRGGVVWALTLPLVAGSVLSAHAVSYTLVGAPGGGVHDYLAHAPQVVAVLATLAACGLALHGRGRGPAPWHYAGLALPAFAAMEHLERIAHTGDVPWLLTRPEFLLGLALQLPAAAAVWVLARALLAARGASPSRPPRLPCIAVELVKPHPLLVPAPAHIRVPARGPPGPR